MEYIDLFTFVSADNQANQKKKSADNQTADNNQEAFPTF